MSPDHPSNISRLHHATEAELEDARKRLKASGARESLLDAVRFAHANISKPKDKEMLARIMAYLNKKPGESSMDEVIFCHEQMAAFERRGILQDSAIVELRRRWNMAEAQANPDVVDRRVVSLNSKTPE
jgi:hypothetical protein